MPQPIPKDVHVDRPLTNISVAFLQDHADYVAERIFPRIPVGKQSDIYFEYDKSFLRDEAEMRAPGTESAGGGYGVAQKTYYAPVWAWHKDVDEQTRVQTDSPLDADRDATLFVTEKLLLKREKEVLAKLFATSTWTGSTTGGDITPGTLWSAAGSKPIDDVDAQSESVKKKSGGKWPNCFVLGAQVYRVLKNHADILDRVKYVMKGVVTPELLATLLAPPNQNDFRVFVASSVENIAKEGASDDLQFIADAQDAVLLHVAPNPGLYTPSAGYIFTWTGLLGASAFGTRIMRIPTPLLGQGSERVEGEISFDCKRVALDMGAYFNEVVA